MRNTRWNEVTPEEQVELGGGGVGGSQGKWCFQAPETQFFQNGLQSGVFFFFKTSAYRFRMDGRKRRLSKTIIPYMSYSEK